MLGGNLLANYGETIAMILFGIGFLLVIIGDLLIALFKPLCRLRLPGER